MQDMTNTYKNTSSEDIKKREEKELQKLLSRAQKLQQMQGGNSTTNSENNTAPPLPEELPPPLPPTPVNASGQPAPAAQMKFSLKSAPKKAAPKMNAFKAFSDDD